MPSSSTPSAACSRPPCSSPDAGKNARVDVILCLPRLAKRGCRCMVMSSPADKRRGDRVVDCAALEMLFTLPGNQGSNPCLSAIHSLGAFGKQSASEGSFFFAALCLFRTLPFESFVSFVDSFFSVSCGLFLLSRTFPSLGLYGAFGRSSPSALWGRVRLREQPQRLQQLNV